MIALAASCTLDAWSREKHVVLEADLDLTGLTFSPIATFGGTFDGQGHTIRGLAITDALSPAGLICTLFIPVMEVFFRTKQEKSELRAQK